MFAVPVVGDFIVLLEKSHEVFGMFFANVIDAKIFNTEGESDRTLFRCPEPWCDFALFVAPFVD